MLVLNSENPVAKKTKAHRYLNKTNEKKTHDVNKTNSADRRLTDWNRVLRGDAVKILNNLSSENKFDVIIADPPYNIGKNFGNNKDQKPLPEYIEWTKSWLPSCLEKLTEDGMLYLYGFSEILARVAVDYPIKRQKWLVWHYTNKTVPSLKFWQRSHETILCLWRKKTGLPQLYVDQIREPYTEHYLKCIGKVRRGTPSRYNGDGKKTTDTVYNGHEHGALPRDVLKIPALAGGAGRNERWFMCRDCKGQVYPPSHLAQHRGHNIFKHPTQKPFALTKRLIQSCTGEKGGRLLVPFVGSGSECVVAQALGVDFLGIEINPEYIKFANKWLKALGDKK